MSQIEAANQMITMRCVCVWTNTMTVLRAGRLTLHARAHTQHRRLASMQPVADFERYGVGSNDFRDVKEKKRDR